MFNLFRIEWLKVKTYRAFWVLFGFFLVFFPLGFFVMASKVVEFTTAKNPQDMMMRTLLGTPFTFPKVWQTSAWLGGIFFIIMGMLFIMIITNEVQYRTHRQNIIDGWSRWDFIKAKVSMLLFFVIVSTVLVFLCGLFGGLLYTPSVYDGNMWSGISYLGYFALMATEYLVVAFLIAVLVKRTGLAIIIYFIVALMADNILLGLLLKNGGQLGFFQPLECTDSLVPNPFEATSFFKLRKVSDTALMITAFCYISLFMFIVTRYFSKADLKT